MISKTKSMGAVSQTTHLVAKERRNEGKLYKSQFCLCNLLQYATCAVAYGNFDAR